MKNFSLNEIVIFSSCMIFFDTAATKINITGRRKWFVGRVPPSSFEYPKLNGEYLPKHAQRLCERDLQCGGFTFKGTQNETSFVPEIYFFHFVNESARYLTTDIKYPHWTTYVVGSRNYVVISGKYNSNRNSQKETIYEEE